VTDAKQRWLETCGHETDDHVGRVLSGGMSPMVPQSGLRRRFLKALVAGLGIIWPILSALIVTQLTLGIIVGLLEGWRMSEGAYFTFVTGLTIGYGDLVPRRFSTRLIAVIIGFIGILMTALIAAVAVHALQIASRRQDARPIMQFGDQQTQNDSSQNAGTPPGVS